MDLNQLCGIKKYQENNVNTNTLNISTTKDFYILETEDNDDYLKKILKTANNISYPSKLKNDKDNNNKLILNKKEYYMNKINEYYNNLDDEIIKKIINIVERKSNISLRLIEWFITKYSINITSLNNNKNNDDYIPISILNSYHIKTKLYQKKYFDLFRRYDVFIYKFKNRDDLQMKTTISQLNFFQWLIENNIYNYIEEHIDELIKIMAEYNALEDDERDRRRFNNK